MTYLLVLAVHKQRDVVPLNIHSDDRESDDDKEEPIFDFKVWYLYISSNLLFNCEN